MTNNVDNEAGKSLAYCKFEVSPFDTHLWGKIEATVYEEGGVNPVSIIGCDQSWYVLVKWWVYGHMVRHLCGEWCVCLYLESIGPGDEYKFTDPCYRIPMNPCPPSYDQSQESSDLRVYGGKEDGVDFVCYERRIRVPAGGINCDPCGSLYLLGVTLTAFDSCGRPGHIGAYCRGATVMFYDPATASD